MKAYTSRLSLCLLALALTSELAGCATQKSQKDADQKELADETMTAKKGKKKKNDVPQNYGLYTKKRDLDRRLLERGKRAQYADALDSY